MSLVAARPLRFAIRSSPARRLPPAVAIGVAAWAGFCGGALRAALLPAPQSVPWRGVWLANVGSPVLDSRRNIEACVDLCADCRINAVFAVTWNRGDTTSPGEVLRRQIGGGCDPRYGTRDPLAELIDAAHRRSIRVVAWFECGFAASS